MKTGNNTYIKAMSQVLHDKLTDTAGMTTNVHNKTTLHRHNDTVNQHWTLKYMYFGRLVIFINAISSSQCWGTPGIMFCICTFKFHVCYSF